LPLALMQFEDRSLPSTITFTAAGIGLDNLVLRFNAIQGVVELLDNTVVVQSKAPKGLSAVTITGNADPLTVDFNFGGLFSIPNGITFNSVADNDTLVVKGPSATNSFALNSGQVTVGGSAINYAGVGSLQVFGLGKNDTITVNSLTKGMATAVDGGTGTTTLTVNGTALNDTIAFTKNQVTVNNNNLSFTHIAQLQINALGGNDTITENGFTQGTAVGVDGGTGTNTFTVNGTAGNDTIVLTTGKVTVNGNNLSFANISQLQVNALDGDDVITVNGLTPGTATTVDGGTGMNTLIVNGTPGADTLALSTGKMIFNGNTLSFANFNQLQINLFAGGDAVTMTGTNPGTVITIDAGSEPNTDTFKGNLPGKFDDNLTLLHFNYVEMHVGGDFTGHFSVQGSGTINDMTVGGSLDGTVASENITTLSVTGDVGPTASVMAVGSGSMGDVTIGGAVDAGAMIASENITTISVTGTVGGTIEANASLSGVHEPDAGNIGSVTTGTILPGGMVMASGSGTIGDMTVNGSLDGTVMSENITTLNVTGDLGPNSTVSASGSGSMGDVTVGGSVDPGATISSEDITTLGVTNNFSGSVIVTQAADVSPPTASGNLGTMTVGGSTEGGTVNVANSIGTISATGGTAGSPVMTIINGGITRTLIATRVDNGNPTPNTVVFDYFYDSSGPGNPQLSVKVTNNPTHVLFDLSLVTSIPSSNTSTTRGFDLAGVFANGSSGIHDIAVEGNLLATMTPAALAHYKLPAGTPGGVQLPLDKLGSVAAQNNVVAGTVRAASVQAVAFGSITQGSVTTQGTAATNVNAAALLAPGTATAQANGTFLVPFFEGQPVALFLVTGSSGFDPNDVLFTDQITDNKSVTATVQVVAGKLTSILLTGDGGAISTALPGAPSITSTGPLGDLNLSSISGIGNVTAPSTFGNMSTGGPIFGTVQTTVGDLGSALTNGSGTIVGTTSITASAITGSVISRGNLVSSITTGNFSGAIAAQGDIGVAYINSTGQLVRFGGISAHSPTGSVVALGNMFGDFNSNGGFSGHIAVEGRTIPGLLDSKTRFGILGGVNVSVGGVRPGSSIVSGGVIGDTDGGTFLSISGAIKGIIAAKEKINFNVSGNMGPLIFDNASINDPISAGVIDAIFVPGSFGSDLSGLNTILNNLNILHVGTDGHLTLM
jgi:hypothetical protein